jgi:hypothetical protein
MTENYLVTPRSFKNYFFKEINLDKFSDLQKNEILDLVEAFFIFLRKNEDLFVVDPQKITCYVIDNDYFLNLRDKSEINLIYLVLKTTQEEIVLNKKRYTKKFKVYTDEINKKKINSSTRANYIHSLDAALMRKVLY